VFDRTIATLDRPVGAAMYWSNVKSTALAVAISIALTGCYALAYLLAQRLLVAP
jgi:hypothetical protein